VELAGPGQGHDAPRKNIGAAALLSMAPIDVIAGNPPWVNWQSLPDGHRALLRPLFARYDLFPHRGFGAILGGANDDLAVIWNKREFRGDVTLEFCGATKMNRSKEKHAWHYDYAADINAAICADGQDLTTGYNFLFGGWHNKFTRLTRGNDILAESAEDIIPSQKTNIHHLWFYLKIQKRGDRLRCWVDNKLLFDKRDPKPLTGRRIALWTWNNGVMVARVRISAADGSRMELLDRPPDSKVKCIYDKS
jgi:hypothetical protein